MSKHKIVRLAAYLCLVFALGGSNSIAQTQSPREKAADDVELFSDGHTDLEVAMITARCSVIFGVAGPDSLTTETPFPEWRIARALARGSSVLARASRTALSRHYASQAISVSQTNVESEVVQLRIKESAKLYEALIALEDLASQRQDIGIEIEDCSLWASKARIYFFLESLRQADEHGQ